jgi:hypothetical protein
MPTTARFTAQAQILTRQSIAIDRATPAFWTGYAAAEVKPVWRLMREELLCSTKLFVGETTAPVLDPGRGRTKKSYFWVVGRGDRPWCGRARNHWRGVIQHTDGPKRLLLSGAGLPKGRCRVHYPTEERDGEL